MVKEFASTSRLELLNIASHNNTETRRATYACSCAWALVAVTSGTCLHCRASVDGSSDGGATAAPSGSARDCGKMRKLSASLLDKSVALSANARCQLPGTARLRASCNTNNNAARCMKRVFIHRAALLLVLQTARSRAIPRHVATSHAQITLRIVSTPST